MKRKEILSTVLVVLSTLGIISFFGSFRSNTPTPYLQYSAIFLLIVVSLIIYFFRPPKNKKELYEMIEFEREYKSVELEEFKSRMYSNKVGKEEFEVLKEQVIKTNGSIEMYDKIIESHED